MALERAGTTDLVRLVFSFLGALMDSGIVGAWPIVQALYQMSGIFGAVCEGGSFPCKKQTVMLANVYTVANGLLVASWCLVGFLFDKLGAKMMSIAGGSLSTIGVLLIIIDLHYRPPLHTELCLIYVGTYFSDLGSSMVRFAIIGFTWHFPAQRGIIMGLQNTAQQFSVAFALIMLHYFTRGTPLLPMYCYFCLMNFVAIFLMAFAAPTRQEYLECFQEASGVDPDEDKGGNTFRRMFKVFCRQPYRITNISSFIGWTGAICNQQEIIPHPQCWVCECSH